MVSDFTSIILFFRSCIGLVFTPYTTMRRLSVERSWPELVWIVFLTLIYFLITNSVRFWLSGFLAAIGLFIWTVLFFSFLPSKGAVKEKIGRMIKTWSYTLIPTLIWFYSTLLFYFLLPPPRTTSLLGKLFSVIYIAFSVSLLIWKLILTYLSIRFSLRIQLYRIIYYILIYLAVSIPLWLILYNGGISRIPFV